MTSQAALQELTAAQERCDAACAVYQAAERAFARSRSKKNTIALIEARDAFEEIVDLVQGLHDAFDAAVIAERQAERAAAARADREAAEFAQPSLF